LADEFKKSESLIKQIIVEGKSKEIIKCQLRDAGITESVIYPDLDGLGRELRQLWEKRK